MLSPGIKLWPHWWCHHCVNLLLYLLPLLTTPYPSSSYLFAPFLCKMLGHELAKFSPFLLISATFEMIQILLPALSSPASHLLYPSHPLFTQTSIPYSPRPQPPILPDPHPLFTQTPTPYFPDSHPLFPKTPTPYSPRLPPPILPDPHPYSPRPPPPIPSDSHPLFPRLPPPIP